MAITVFSADYVNVNLKSVCLFVR